MKKMLKVYFLHPSIQIYWAFLIFLTGLCHWLGLWESETFFFFLPVLILPFFEWIAHKFLLHKIVPQNAGAMYEYQKILHYNHHLDPSDEVWIFAPRSSAFAIFLFIFLLFSLLGLDFRAGLAGMTSSTLVFLYYEWVHLGHHMPGYNHLTPYGRYMKRFHQWHHYSNDRYWWGITSHLGDILFKTCPDPKTTPHSPYIRDIGRPRLS